MARSITEIFDNMTSLFVANTTIVTMYELDTTKSFSEQFSKVSFERIVFYIIASAIWLLETIFDAHKSEVNTTIETILPHRPKWYRDKVLAFMKDKTLIPDTDQYDTTGMSDAEIEAAKVITYATADEESGSSVLVIKIATGTEEDRSPVAPEVEAQVIAYVEEIKDAGVKFSIVNQNGDDFYCELDIYFSALLLLSDVELSVRNAIKKYITGLKFNGEYSNMALVDAIQQLDGVIVVEFKSAKTNNNYINGKITPNAGYFTYVDENVSLQLISISA